MRKMLLFVGMILVLVLGFGMSALAVSTEGKLPGREEYQQMEAQYTESIRGILLEKGCKNAGITLTYIVDSEGKREYTVTIHHRKLEKMTREEWILLQARIQEAGMDILLNCDIHMVKILSDI